MKDYNHLKKREKKANPTIDTQEKIIKVIKNSKKPISITSISKLSKTGFNETKSSIIFLHKLQIVDLIVSTGNTTFVILSKKGDKNATIPTNA